MSRSTFLAGPCLLAPWVGFSGHCAGLGASLSGTIAGVCTLAYWAIAWALFPDA